MEMGMSVSWEAEVDQIGGFPTSGSFFLLRTAGLHFGGTESWIMNSLYTGVGNGFS